MADPPVRAVVQKIVRERNRTPYVVAIREDNGDSITFTLQKHVWREDDDPDPSDVVLLSNFRETEKGPTRIRFRVCHLGTEQQPTPSGNLGTFFGKHVTFMSNYD